MQSSQRNRLMIYESINNCICSNSSMIQWLNRNEFCWEFVFFKKFFWFRLGKNLDRLKFYLIVFFCPRKLVICSSSELLLSYPSDGWSDVDYWSPITSINFDSIDLDGYWTSSLIGLLYRWLTYLIKFKFKK